MVSTDGDGSAAPCMTVIEPGAGGFVAGLREAFARRDVLVFLARRDIAARYKQTFFGMAWAVLQPLTNMVLFTFVFHRVAGIRSGEVPYALFTFVGLLIWQLFQSSLQQTTQSIVRDKNLIMKIYFPRILTPASSIAVSLIDFCIAFFILIALFVWFGVEPTWRLVLIPVMVAAAALSAFSFGIWLTALNARFRDVQVLAPFALRIWLFLSPVAYPREEILAQIPAGWKWIYHLNPMASIVDGFRWSVLGVVEVDPAGLVISGCVTILLLVTGYAYFRRVERTIVDIL